MTLKTKSNPLISLVLTGLFSVFVYSQENILNFNENLQSQDQWCWAATSKSIIEFFEGNAPSQCEIAEWARLNTGSEDLAGRDYGDENCCVNPSGDCNYWNYNWGSTGSVVAIVENFTSAKASNYKYPSNGSYYTLDEFKSFVDDSKLSYIRWGWKSGGGHFVVGYGYSDSTVFYMDPLPNEGFSMASYEWMINDGKHEWTHTNLYSKVGFAGSFYSSSITSSSELSSSSYANLSSESTSSSNETSSSSDSALPVQEINLELGVELVWLHNQWVLQVKREMRSVRITSVDGKTLRTFKNLPRGEYPLNLGDINQKLFVRHQD